jgi:hypothetical protein
MGPARNGTIGFKHAFRRARCAGTGRQRNDVVGSGRKPRRPVVGKCCQRGESVCHARTLTAPDDLPDFSVCQYRRNRVFIGGVHHQRMRLELREKMLERRADQMHVDGHADEADFGERQNGDDVIGVAR